MKKTVTIFLFSVLMSVMLSVSAKAEELMTPSGIYYSDIQAEIEEYVKECEEGLASVEVAVFDGNKTIYNGYFGYADMENSIVADKETVYEWGSCSKLLVWVSVMQLYERGLIDLETDIRTYLPDGFLTKLRYEEPITMLNLMSHTAGWQETVYHLEVTEPKDIDSLEVALKNTEPIQAYEPGEHTAYSNWGTALAAFIVQQVSGMDYVDYVHENIFNPLGMEHTSVGVDFSDNAWVKEKRAELKSYMIMEDMSESYGSNISYILLYPAGSATGTLADFETFAKAFTCDSCPFFEKSETRDRMFLATTYYGESDIVKNCHGLWTYEYAVQAMGHGGNTNACSSMLQFDPASGLGVVVMTNECAETAFNNGIPSILFGDCKEGEITDASEISGVYISSRGYPFGVLNLFNYIGSGVFMPVMKTDDENTFNIVGIEMRRIADNQWIQDNGNGTKIFFYETYRDGKRVFETMSTDYTIDPFYWCKIASIIVVILLALASGIIMIIKAVRRRKFENRIDKSIFLAQIMQIMLGITLFVLLSVTSITRTFVIIFCLFEAMIAFASLINATSLIYATIKSSDIKKYMVVRNIFWTLCSIFTCGFILYFQLYRFWS